MKYLNLVDYGVITMYLLILLVIGQYLKKRASASLDDYFLAGRKMPWWALGVSSMAAWLDMTGTMVIVSFLYLLGPRGLYVEIRGGACMVLVFLMLWTGKWHRRSGVMTGAEWIAFRFGAGFWGNFARLASVFAMVRSFPFDVPAFYASYLHDNNDGGNHNLYPRIGFLRRGFYGHLSINMYIGGRSIRNRHNGNKNIRRRYRGSRLCRNRKSAMG